jgi:hypothetical protein
MQINGSMFQMKVKRQIERVKAQVSESLCRLQTQRAAIFVSRRAMDMWEGEAHQVQVLWGTVAAGGSMRTDVKGFNR